MILGASPWKLCEWKLWYWVIRFRDAVKRKRDIGKGLIALMNSVAVTNQKLKSF